MDYISVREVAEKWRISPRMVNYYCVTGWIVGAQRTGNMWVVPKDAKKPDDRRKKGGYIQVTRFLQNIPTSIARLWNTRDHLQ